MKKRPIIVAALVISAISLITGMCYKSSNNLCEDKKTNKTEVVEKCGLDKEKLHYPQKHSINYPEEINFEKYYEYALDVYEYATSGKDTGLLVFDNANDMYMFQSKIRSTVLNESGIPVLESFAKSYAIKTDRYSALMPMNAGYKELKELNEVEDFIISLCGDNGITDLELIEIINKWLINNTEYDYEFNKISYSELGVVRNKRAVCDGYADFIKIACDLYGIPCEKVIGHGKKDRLHAWNKVKIEDEWYYLDSTWNVCLKTNEYFLAKELWNDHSLKKTT